jgi:hypothetical protein
MIGSVMTQSTTPPSSDRPAQLHVTSQSMMAASLNENQIKVLEQTRQRLVQLTHSLGSLAGSLQHSDPLPSWLVRSFFRLLLGGF